MDHESQGWEPGDLCSGYHSPPGEGSCRGTDFHASEQDAGAVLVVNRHRGWTTEGGG